MIVDGEDMTMSQIRGLIKFFDDHCREKAGIFFDRCRKGLFGDAGRSETFRAFWSEVGFRCGKDPQFCYVETHYLNFAEEIRAMFAELCGRPDVREKDKDKMHKAIVIQEMLGLYSQHTPVQLREDSQQFAGDGYEVKSIGATFGGSRPQQSLINKLMNSTATTRH